MKFRIITGLLLFTILLSSLRIKNLNLIDITKDLFDFAKKSSSTAYLNGIKAFCTIMIVLYHCDLSRAIFPFKSGENLQKFLTGLFYQPILASGSLMEVFFVIGGILTAKSLKKEFENQ